MPWPRLGPKSRSADDTDSNRQWGAGISAISWPICRRNHPFQPPRNNVGYDFKPVSNYKFVGTEFTKVGGGEEMTIGDLKTNCDMTGETGTGWQAVADSVVQLNENGTFVRRLVFLPGYIAEEIEGKPAEGWYDNEAVAIDDYSTCLNNEPMTFGIGIQVSTDEGAEVRFAGEVKNAPTVTDVEGYMVIANCSTKALKIGDLLTNCDMTGELGTGWQALADSVVLLNENGTFVRRLVFLPGYIAEEIEGKPAEGWYDNEDVALDDYTDCWNDKVEWKPGEGFQVSTDAGATITIKSSFAE